MSDAYLQYTNEDEGIVARWWGGEYIELGYITPNDMEFHAVDVINVWDHSEGKAMIDFTTDALAETVEDHFNDDDEEDDDDGE